MKDAFLSYAKADAAAVSALRAGLVTAGCQLWYDDAELRAGEPWRDQVRSGIADARALLVVFSEAWRASPACDFEHRCASERRTPVVVVSVGGSLLSIEIPAPLREPAVTWIREESLARTVEATASWLRACRDPHHAAAPNGPP